MPVSGLVLTLSADAELSAQVIAQLKARPELAPGELADRWLPVALETRDAAESQQLHDWLHGLAGVEFVDVVYVNFES